MNSIQTKEEPFVKLRSCSYEYILAIESSCDDTSIAIVRSDAWVLAMESLDQNEQHKAFGGIVPEVASRCHSQKILLVLNSVLAKAELSFKDLSAIAVTTRPGLVGSLLVGLMCAKTIAQVTGLPLIAVNHLEGHIAAPFLRDESYEPLFNKNENPFLSLAVSGGHSSLYWVKEPGVYEIIGTTIDDAAGEAFDKLAKKIGLGFPGGQKVDQMAKAGNPKAFDFPRSKVRGSPYHLSFSGLKSSAARLVDSLLLEQEETQNFGEKAQKPLAKEQSFNLSQLPIHDICASYQEAIVDILLDRLSLAADEFKLEHITLTGGVAANSRLRARLKTWAEENKKILMFPPLRYCTDNAAMIALAAFRLYEKKEFSALNIGPSPTSIQGDFSKYEFKL